MDGLSQESIVGESPSVSTDEPLREVPIEDIPAAPRKRKFTSEVWNHYTRETVVDPKKGGIPVIKAKCKRCHAMLGGGPKNGTTHLKHHLKRCPRKHVRIDVDQQLLNVASSTSMDGSITLENYKFNQENSSPHSSD